MTASVASFLTQAQKSGSELPSALSGALLLAAIRLSEHRQQSLRPYQLLVDDDGTLELLAGEPPTADGYAAPELRAAAALPHDPRVLVYAAGALGYELVTLAPPRLSGEVGPELAGPFAPVIRKAMSERRDRFRSLKEMELAVERVQARPTPEEERVILAAVASSTQLPAAQKLAKIELLRAAGAAGTEPPPQMPAPFTPQWDGLEPSADMEVPAQPSERREEPLAEPDETQGRPEVEQAQQHDDPVQPAGLEELAKLQARVEELEQQVRSSPPPPASLAAALAREVKLLLDERRFGEAERARSRPARTRRDYRLALSAALGAVAATALSLFLRPAAPARAVTAAPNHVAVAHVLSAAPVAPLEAAPAPVATPALAAIPEAAAPAAAPAHQAGPAADRSPALAREAAPAADRSPALAREAAPAADRSPALAREAAPAADRSPALAREAAPDPDRKPASPPDPERKPARAPALARDPAPDRERKPDPPRKPHSRRLAAEHDAAQSQAVKGDKALRAFDTRSAQSAFESALKLDPMLPSAHRGMGMVYVLLGRNGEAKSEYAKYLQLAPDAPDRDQIERLLSR